MLDNRGMEPDVRYCTASDGVRIAYTVTGEGSPHLWMWEPAASHVQLEWSQPVWRPYLEELARHNLLIRYDARGTGLSDRIQPSGGDVELLDLETVVAHLGLGAFALSANQTSSAVAVMFAARHPEKVKRLVLVDPVVRLADMYGTAQARAVIAAAAIDFVMATELIGSMSFGTGRDESRDFGAYMRSCIGPEWFANIERRATIDASAAAPKVSAPTLIIYHRNVQYVAEGTARDLASQIPDARLTVVDGLWADDPIGVSRRMAAFINADAGRQFVRERDSASGVRTVLFTDVVGHTEMMQRLGDVRGRDVLRDHERITRETLRRHGGREIKTDGDSFLISFGSVMSAIECAIALQRAFASREGEPLHVRMGLNAGEPIEDDGDLFGATVILAARVKEQAGAGQILVPDTVRGLLSGKGFVFGDRGEFLPKGFEEAVRLWDVRWLE
jgi:class 3 adenylate cyclase